ncbi:MAG: hypothetical protein ACREX8_16700, partial [Gammaproteobacteria bacterium]
VLDSLAGLFSEVDVEAATVTAQQAAEELVGSAVLDQETGASMSTAFREVLNEFPEAAGLTEEDIRELFAELAEESAQEAQS